MKSKPKTQMQREFIRYFSRLDIDLSDRNARAALAGNREARRKCRKIKRIVNVMRAVYRHALAGDKRAQALILKHWFGPTGARPKPVRKAEPT